MKKKLKYLCIFLILSQQSLAGNSDLSYEYSVPYSGGASLTITNHGLQTLSISTLSFSSNAAISGTPWGTLWGWQSSIAAKPNPDGINTDYTITESPQISIAPTQSVVLNYNINPALIGGPFSPYNAAMDSFNVRVVPAGSTTALDVDIEGACQAEACRDPGAGKVILGYYPNWAYWRSPKFTAANLPVDKINHISYAFSIFDKDGKISLYDQDSDAFNLPILSQARKRYPYLNLSLSFGGWSWASTPPGWSCQTGTSPAGPALCFSEMAANDQARAKFVAAAVKGMKEVHFNGIDIDWEYPSSANDPVGYVKLLTELRQALDNQGAIDKTHYLLTIAVPAGIDKIQLLTAEQWQTVAALVDSVNVMTYDFHGAWDQGQVGSDFMSAMALDPNLDPSVNNATLKQYTVMDALSAYLDRGVAPSKLIVGIPVYGRMVNIESQGPYLGLYQAITGTPQGEWDNQQSGFTGMLDYSCIVDATHCGNGYQRPSLTLIQPSATNPGDYSKTPWAYGSSLFLTYDDNVSASYKALWALNNRFQGVMLWDLSGDLPDTDQRSIVNAIDSVFQSNTILIAPEHRRRS